MSTSGYYDWIHRKPSKQKRYKEEVCKQIQQIHKDSHDIYGAPKITVKLQEAGYPVSQKTTSKYMKEIGIKAHFSKKWVVTTISKEVQEELRNVLSREFNANKPNKVWCTDITYIWTMSGFVYLTSIMDLYSRKIVLWEVSDCLSLESVLNCVRQAKARRLGVSVKVMLHSDRGVQYTSKDYADELLEHQRSYSRKGNPWDNACIESFHASIKREWINRYNIQGLQEAKRIIFE